MAQPLRLDTRDWMDDPATQAIVRALDTGPGTVRFVGGCVRNALLGEPIEDLDLATVHEPQRVTALIEAAGLKAIPTGIDHGTITAVANGQPFEITTLRADVETHGRHATVEFTQDWIQDAHRRDFTMNAIYADPDGTLFDPVNGVDDARARQIRFIGDPDQRIQEDYLRILRFFRFNARYGGGHVDQDGLDACARHKSGLKQLSGERIQGELLKLLNTSAAADILCLMENAGVLAEVLPEAAHFDRLRRLIAIENSGVIDADPVRRLAVLVRSEASAIEDMAARLRLSNHMRDRLIAVTQNQTPINADMDERQWQLAVYRLGFGLFEDCALACQSSKDATQDATGDAAWRRLLEKARQWSPPRFPLSGQDVMAAGVPQGPDVGRLLDGIEQWWAEGGFAADRKVLLDRVKAEIGH